jgi:acetyltransferase
MYKYSRDVELLYETPSLTPDDFEADSEQAKAIIDAVFAAGRTTLMENEAKDLLHCYGIEVSKNKVCREIEDAVEFAQQIGFPVVMKIASPDITHKTDAGGVKLNINNSEEVRVTFKQILTNAKRYRADARIDGVLVERMVKKGFELLVGAKKDPIFGPVVVFGRGGVAVEVHKDVRMGLPPLNMALAHRIISNTQMYPLLKGYRGMPGVDLDELAFLLDKSSYLIMDFPQINEIDINPYVVDSKGGLALDARVGLDPACKDGADPGKQHLVISPYPGEKYSRTVTLENGKEILLRPIRPEDEPMEAEMLKGLSDYSMNMRFFGYIPKVTHTWLTRFTHIDYDREMAIVAILEEDGKEKMLGVVRIIEDAWRETAEYAIVVADEWQKVGLGNIMTDFIMEIARKRKIKKVIASVLSTNEPMIHMFKSRGFSFKRVERDMFDVEYDMEQESANIES